MAEGHTGDTQGISDIGSSSTAQTPVEEELTSSKGKPSSAAQTPLSPSGHQDNRDTGETSGVSNAGASGSQTDASARPAIPVENLGARSSEGATGTSLDQSHRPVVPVEIERTTTQNTYTELRERPAGKSAAESVEGDPQKFSSKGGGGDIDQDKDNTVFRLSAPGEAGRPRGESAGQPGNMAEQAVKMPAKLPKFTKEKKDEKWKEFMNSVKKVEKAKNILVIGEQGVGKSSFINSNMTSIAGKYKYKAPAGMMGDSASHVTVKLKRYTPDKYTDDDKDKDSDTAQKLPSFIDVMGFDDNLSNKILEAVTKESKEEEESESDKLSTTVFGQLEESVNSILMEYILRGRIPDTCNLLNFGKMIMQGRSEELDSLDYLKVKDHMKVDAVVMIISRSSKTLPKKLIKSVRQETKKKDIDIPLFGVMTKMDIEEGDWKKLEMEFKRELGIDGNYFIPVVNYLHEDLMTDEPEPNPNIDVPLLKMLNKIYETEAEETVILEDQLNKKLREKRKEEQKMGCCFYVLIVVVVVLLLAAVAFLINSRLKQPVMPPESPVVPPESSTTSPDSTKKVEL